MFHINVVLFEPEIPQNTGNIARTCAAVGATLHLIKPLGFSIKDRYLKRAGLDYWNLVEIIYHDDISEFLYKNHKGNLFFITKTASKIYDEADYSGKIFLIFGKETAGLPDNILTKNADRCYRIPMKEESRSLNLSNAVAIVVYEALRQNGFPDLKLQGRHGKSEVD